MSKTIPQRTLSINFPDTVSPQSDHQPDTGPALLPAEAMARFGITCVPVNYFHYGDFRYTNLSDAIAQAKSGRTTGIAAAA